MKVDLIQEAPLHPLDQVETTADLKEALDTDHQAAHQAEAHQVEAHLAVQALDMVLQQEFQPAVVAVVTDQSLLQKPLQLVVLVIKDLLDHLVPRVRLEIQERMATMERMVTMARTPN